ncbi:MAG: hypothetical protein MJE63_32500 [Proteobacteria bacterium]|nr:hypothetical protein [Pseudomonadota bacterium]
MTQEKVYQHEFFSTSGVNDFQFKIKDQPPAGYPSESVPDSYAKTCFETDYQKRREAYIKHCLNNPGSSSVKGHYLELIRIHENQGPVFEGVLLAALEYINQRKDCSDFVMLGIVRLLYQLKNNDLCSSELINKSEQTILDFKYWPDEPGIDSMCYWTENHQVMFSVNEYLAGQYFPTRTFTNSGMTGEEKKAKAYPRILKWLELRFKTGFSEWLSHIYFDEDLTALINLVDFCDDEILVKKAQIVADTLLFDIAVNSYYGQFVSTHGRSYTKEKLSALKESTIDTAKLLFGMGVFAGEDNMSAVTLALSKKYQLPKAIFNVANDTQNREILNKQRVAINIADAAKWGLNLGNVDDGMILLSYQAYVHPRMINTMIKILDAFRWWENQFFPEFKALKWFMKIGRYVGLTRLVATLFERDLGRNTVEEANLYTYRTPDYMLSSAQDYKKGFGADQHHIWQATLEVEAICFTTHPGGYGDTAPNGYWQGSGFLPRIAQCKNVVIILYKLPKIGGLLVPKVLPFTHAWFPRDKFDEVFEKNGWIFGRKSSGYIALYAGLSYRWQTEGEYRDKEVIIDGRKSAWICELGSEQENGSFDEFCKQVAVANLSIKKLQVDYHSPGQGRLQFDWKGDLKQNGSPVNLAAYPRYDNPYCQSAFPPEMIEIEAKENKLTLDLESNIRDVDEFV